MIPINPILLGLCEALQEFTPQKNYNQPALYEKCVAATQKLLVYCKTTPNLSLDECTFINKSITAIKNVPYGPAIVRITDKIRKILRPAEKTPWPTIFPRAFISKNCDKLFENKPLDLERAAGVISFLNKYSPLLDPSRAKTPSDQMTLQIIRSFFHLNSPFHLNFSLPFLKSLPGLNPFLLNFLSHPQNEPINNGPHSLQTEDIKNLHATRLGLLREFFSFQPKKSERIAIIGAGPAGLLRAILCSLMGFEVLLLEKRPHHLNREIERNNTLVLGHHGSGDLDILSILGIWDKLVECNALTPASYYNIYTDGYYLTISDLEKCALLVLEELFPGTFHSNIEKFSLESTSNEAITLQFNNTSTICHSLILCDGAHSPTLSSLGIQKAKYAKTAYAITAFFEKKIGATTSENLDYSEREKQEIGAHCGVLLRHKQDYLGSPLNRGQRSLLEKEATSKQEIITRIAIENYRQLVKMIYSQELPLEETLPLSCSLVPLKMDQAESPLFFHENVPILLRGDAYGTVHPASGYGAKTAIESLKADGIFFSYFTKNSSTEELHHHFTTLAEQIFILAQNRSLSFEGSNCDKPCFFLEQAKKRNLISPKEQAKLHNLIMKRKYNALLEDETPFLLSLKMAVISNFWQLYGEGTTLFNDNLEATPSLVKKAEKWTSLLKTTNIYVLNSDDFARFLLPAPRTPKNHMLRIYALDIIRNSSPEEVEPRDLAALLGTLSWIEFTLNNLQRECAIL